MTIGLYIFGIFAAAIILALLLNKSFHVVWFSMLVVAVFWVHLHGQAYDKLDPSIKDAFTGAVLNVMWTFMLLMTVLDDVNNRLKKLEEKKQS